MHIQNGMYPATRFHKSDVVTKIMSPLICKVEMSFLSTFGVWRGRAETSRIGDLPRHLRGFFGPARGAFVQP